MKPFFKKIITPFKNLYKKIYHYISMSINLLVEHRRTSYYKRLRKKIKVNTPSIIANNCLGSFIYHNLGLQFKSPTINLYFSKNDFFLFIEHLKDFLQCELDEVIDTEKTFPVGKLSYAGNDIFIYFMHYKTFEEAKNKWNERKNRVDLSNIRIVFMEPYELTETDIVRFENLPYEHKYLISNKKPWKKDFIYTNKVFSKRNYKPGKILNYKNSISKKRYMDDLPYVKWINSKSS